MWSDSEARNRDVGGSEIGMADVKRRRLGNELESHPGLHVGDCVPFYFCSRSVMLYVIHMSNHPDLEYRGGQGPIIHLEADLRKTVAYAEMKGKRWAFTSSNAGSNYFEDFSDLSQLKMLNWDAIRAKYWQECRGEKQAEFLIEGSFPWALISRIGVRSRQIHDRVLETIRAHCHRPPVEVKPGWYY